MGLPEFTLPCVEKPVEVRKGRQIPWLLAVTWVLGTKSGSSAKAVSAPNYQAISPAPRALGLTLVCEVEELEVIA